MGYSLGSASNTVDDALMQYFSWAGSKFPYNVGASDITISANTTWNDSVGYKKVKKLTINAGITLTIAKSPFFIFADEINFGSATSCIDASGAGAKGAMQYWNPTYCWCGNGGGLLIIVANSITGANGIIKANGLDAGSGPSLSGVSQTYVGGFGALSNLTSALAYQEDWCPAPASNASVLAPLDLGRHLASGGGARIGTGGGSGGWVNSTSTAAGGGSGIGGGAGGYSSTSPFLKSGEACRATLTLAVLVQLALAGCKGGGGGAGMSYPSAGSLALGGGGGGGLGIFAHNQSATPTLQANGGNSLYQSATPTSTYTGGAGVAYLALI